MPEPAYPSQVGPPPLPVSAPAFPAQAVGAPPAFRGAHDAPFTRIGPLAPLPPPPPPASQSSYAPPAYMLAPDGNDGVPRWMFWAVPGFIGLMITGGVIVFLGSKGQLRAAAGSLAPPPPRRMPPARAVPSRSAIAPSSPTVGRTPSVPPPARATQAPPKISRVASSGSLPPLRDVDLQLKRLWQIAEEQGIAVKSLKTLRSSRQDGMVVQPVKLELTATFPQAVVFLQNVRAAMPFAMPETVTVSQWPKTPSSPAITLPPSMTLNLYLADDFGAARGAAAPAPDPPVDLAGAFADTARHAQGRLCIVEMALKPRTGASAARVTVTGLAADDGEVADFLGRLKGTALVDVNLLSSEATQLDGRPVRRFTIEYRVRPPGDPRAAEAAATWPGPRRAEDVPDVFCLTPSLEAAIARLQAVQPARPVPQQGPVPETFQRLSRLKLLAVVDADRCVINGQVLRKGEKIDGFTVRRITPNSVTIDAPTGEGFELRVKK